MCADVKMEEPEPAVRRKHAVQEALEKVLASAGFARNERLSRFLRFVVECDLAGHHTELKESVVGIEVFGRKPGFDPKLDSTVRSEAARLRARLLEYYAGDGKTDSLRITLPKGGYVPQYEFRDAPAEPGSADAASPKAPVSALRLVALAALLIVGFLAWWWVVQPVVPITVAVLPLQNVRGNPADEYFADGLTDELIRSLSIIDGMAPRSRTSSFALKGQSLSARDVGRLLEADYLLEGSVLRSREQLRVDVQFVRVRDDRPIWSGRFDRDVTDVVAIQDEIASGIVNSLRLSLGRGRRRYETSADAYDLYLRARALEGMRGLSDSVGAFEAVIAKDPFFAPAYAGLAAAHAARSRQFRFDLPDEVLSMRSAAEKAIDLDPLLAEAHDALGIAYTREGQWQAADKSFHRAIELDPRNAEPRGHLALDLLLPLGRIDEALRQLALAQKLDPLSPTLHASMIYALVTAARFDEAAEHCGKLLPDNQSECLGRVRLGQGRVNEAIQVLETAYKQGLPPGNEVRGYLGYAYARAGRRADAERLLAMTPPINPFNFAVIYAGLGEKDRVFQALDRASAAGPVRIGWVLGFPEYAVLRGDPRVNVLRKAVGLLPQ
jgi:TolB-like protein/tetratricopeptide (TPR) repeat protein